MNSINTPHLQEAAEGFSWQGSSKPHQAEESSIFKPTKSKFGTQLSKPMVKQALKAEVEVLEDLSVSIT
jgi:hypothetical protein